MSAKRYYLSLGSNLGNRQENLGRALQFLSEDRLCIRCCSSIYETEPRDVSDQPWFLNLVVECETALEPPELLTRLQKIERSVGRVRSPEQIARGPRVIDIDILLCDGLVLDSPDLTIPHARMLERRFVLEPLLEIAPGLKHPMTQEPLIAYLDQVKKQRIHRITGVITAKTGIITTKNY